MENTSCMNSNMYNNQKLSVLIILIIPRQAWAFRSVSEVPSAHVLGVEYW